MATQKKSLVSNMKASKKAQAASKKDTKGTKVSSLTTGLRHNSPTQRHNFRGNIH